MAERRKFDRDKNGSHHRKNEMGCQKSDESFVLFVGDSQSGKTTLINNFIGTPSKGPEEDRYKPTVAVQYYFARAEKHHKDSGSTTGNLANIWELGGGIPKGAIKEFFSILLPSARVKNSLVAIAVNLSVVEDVIPSLVEWVRITRTVVMECSSKEDPDAKSSNSSTATSTKTAEDGRPSEFPVPLLIVANNYDSFLRIDKRKRDVITMALRSIACANCATLVFAGTHDVKAKENCRIATRQLFFTRLVPTGRAKPSSSDQSSSNSIFDGALLVWANSDSYEKLVKDMLCAQIFSESELDGIRSSLPIAKQIASTEFWSSVSESYFGKPSRRSVKWPSDVEEDFILPRNDVIDEAINTAKLISQSFNQEKKPMRG